MENIVFLKTTHLKGLHFYVYLVILLQIIVKINGRFVFYPEVLESDYYY